MAHGQHRIWPVGCFSECRLDLSPTADEYTTRWLEKLSVWPWVGKEHFINGRPLRVIFEPENGYVLVFDVTAELVVRPIVVFEHVENITAFFRGLPGLMRMVIDHSIMVAMESGH